MNENIELKAIGFQAVEEGNIVNSGYIVFDAPLIIKDIEDGADKVIIVKDSIEEITDCQCVINLDHKLNKNVDQLKSLKLNETEVG